MSIEIERKFLVYEDLVPEADEKVVMAQAYLQAEPERTVRVRIAGDQAFLTIKGEMHGISRAEFEYEIPLQDAEELIKLAVWEPVKKVRHIIYLGGKKWEIDFFEGENQGLILAEVELQNEDDTVELPSWIKREVTGDFHYHNSYLAQHPFTHW